MGPIPQCHPQSLQPSNVSSQLENPQDPHNTKYLGNPSHLSLVVRMLTLALSLVDVDLNIRSQHYHVIREIRNNCQAHQRHNQGHEVGENSEKINNVHDPFDKPKQC